MADMELEGESAAHEASLWRAYIHTRDRQTEAQNQALSEGTRAVEEAFWVMYHCLITGPHMGCACGGGGAGVEEAITL